MTSSLRCSSSKSRPGANPTEETAGLDDLLAQINVADVLCKALARALEGADATSIDNAVGAVAVRMTLLEQKTVERAFWRRILRLMSDNNHVPLAAKTAARRALSGRYSPDAMSFFAECIIEHMRPKEVDCNNNTPTEGTSAPGDAVVPMLAT
jgi:hypothetical protein